VALLDEKRDALVIRIVYDGPPLSGKTTTLRALADGFSRPLHSPQEHDGRTLFFDWLDYTAGRFEGRPIRCQIVSVPGQRSLADRRRWLLQDADSIVFVADTGSLGMDLSVKYARELGSVINSFASPRPGVVIQANKRDVEDALPIPEVLKGFRAAGIEAGVIETRATTGTGVREGFLFGVRLALDRARELNARGLLKSASPHIDSAEDLFREITVAQDAGKLPGNLTRRPGAPFVRAAQSGTPPAPSPASTIPGEAPAPEEDFASAKAMELSQINLPDPSVPSGSIWPPVEGRIMVQQALATAQLTARQLPSGDCQVCSPNGWRMHSRARDVFEDQNIARSALSDWARLHVRNHALLSARRCVLLSPAGSRWRLWQIVGQTRSLEDALALGLDTPLAHKAAETLFVVASKLIAALRTFGQATVALPAILATVAADSTEPRYTGLMPGFDVEGTAGPVRQAADPATVLRDRMSKPVAACVERFGQEALRSELDVVSRASADNEHVAVILRQTLKAIPVA
jgi:signal recognition particle receptor subunit beta